MDFVDFNLAKKLKEKGFSCEMPFAMYNEIAAFHLLTTSAPYCVCASGYKCRDYYDYEDFDEHDYIAPTIDQVLNWLREKNIILSLIPSYFEGNNCLGWDCDIWVNGNYEHRCVSDNSYESAALAGIEYVLNNLI